MCIDLVGSDYIDRVHYFGTHMQNARAVNRACAIGSNETFQALAALGDRAGKFHWLRNLRGSLTDPKCVVGKYYL